MSYGWRDFDPEIVEAVKIGHPEHVVKRSEAGMTCPLIAHEREWLHWQDGNYAKGTVPHGAPAVSFRVSPTYILSDPLDNFIAGRDLIKQVVSGGSGKAETHRLGNENSEDALTWNVFRSLQEAKQLHLLPPLLCEWRKDTEPDLYLWGKQITDGAIEPWQRLEKARGEIEPNHRQQTEPDAVLHLPDWGWIFIEAKFGSRVTVWPSEERKQAWLRHYIDKAPWLFNLDEIGDVPPHQFPEQLLRNIIFASRVADEEEQAQVVLLAREKELAPVEDWLRRCLSDECHVGFSRASWEQIHQGLPPGDPALNDLRRYLEDKSYALRQAFQLP